MGREISESEVCPDEMIGWELQNWWTTFGYLPRVGPLRFMDSLLVGHRKEKGK